MGCYTFEKKIFTDGIFNSCVDATYIIHLTTNDRYLHIQKQLEKYHPTNIVYILFNKGPTCDKNIENNIPPIDLVDAYFKCFQHARINNYSNILILEDDFVFSESVKEPDIIANICHFIKSKQGEPMQYLLGCIPLLIFPCSYDFNHYTGFSMGTHAVIYNKMYYELLLKQNQSDIQDWDIFNNSFVTKYMYSKPLCYQLFPRTENSKYWGFQNPIFFLLGKMIFFIYQLFGLNKNIEPGYSFFYIFSKIWFLLVVFICFYTLKIHKIEAFRLFKKKS